MNRRIAHLIDYQPPAPGQYDYTTDLMGTLLSHAGLRLQDGLLVRWTTAEDVAAQLAAYQPHLVLVWEQHGRMLRALTGRKTGIDDLKGYVWRADHVCPGTKCIATYAPARVRMEWSLTGVVKANLQRAARESLTDELVVPEREVLVLAPWHGFTAPMVVERLRIMQSTQRPLAYDIEGACAMGPSCHGFAPSPRYAEVVPIMDVDGCSIWSEEDEVLIVQAVADLLQDVKVPKIIQNFMWEGFSDLWALGLVIQGLQDDTMVKGFEAHCELEKSLEFLAMLYTNQPWWKLEHRVVEGRYVPFKDGRRATTEEWYVYNGTDCMVTWEVNAALDKVLKPKQREHYQFNMQLLTPLLYMSARGIHYDKQEARRRLTETQLRIYELQDQINREAAGGRPALQQFYRALEMGSQTQAVDAYEAGLVPLLTSAFCCCERDRAERREVEEVSWQPHSWNGKKWVRKGRRVTSIQDLAQQNGLAPWVGTLEPAEAASIAACCKEGETSPEDHTKFWLKPVRKQVTKRVPVEVTTFEDVRKFTKDSCKAGSKRALELVGQFVGGRGGPSECGELATLLGIHVNTESTQKGGDAQWFLYEWCKFPKQHKKNKETGVSALTTDTEALLKIVLATNDERAKLVLKLRAAFTESETLAKQPDEDGRIRTAYNAVGTDTCRLSSSESPTGEGFNLQTVTKKHRDLFVADDGYEMYQADLSGADSWTVAAQAARHNDRTMLDDLLNKLKPAKIVALMQLHGVSVNSKDRNELRLLSKEVPDEGGLYPASKATSHGSNYGMKGKTMSTNILKQSYKKTGEPLVVDPKQCDRLQGYYFTRYPGVLRWQREVDRLLMNGGVLITSTGFQRRFFGRKDEGTTQRAAYSLEPQCNTTWACNKFLLRMWVDPDNRREDGSLIVEPLHQIHDAGLFQAPVDKREWTVSKMADYFNNPINIAGTTVVIPYEAGVGPNWRKLEALG